MFENISNINQFASNKKMNMLWNLKKDGLLLSPSSQIASISNKERNLASITNKLMNGKRLTPDEMRYLREHSPDTYRQAVEADAERSSYEAAAKSCRSKADVQNLHAKSVSMILASAKADPIGAQIKAAAVADAHVTFVQSSAYNKLPSSAEEQNKDTNDSKKNKSKTNTTKERPDLMQEMTVAEQNIQFSLRNYHARAEKRANAEASSESEPTTDEATAFAIMHSSAESSKAYLQSKGITVENPMENHVSFSSLLNNNSSPSSGKAIASAILGSVDSVDSVGSAFLGRAHAAYVTARSTVISTDAPAVTANAVKSGLRAKA